MDITTLVRKPQIHDWFTNTCHYIKRAPFSLLSARLKHQFLNSIHPIFSMLVRASELWSPMSRCWKFLVEIPRTVTTAGRRDRQRRMAARPRGGIYDFKSLARS